MQQGKNVDRFEPGLLLKPPFSPTYTPRKTAPGAGGVLREGSGMGGRWTQGGSQDAWEA